MVGEGQMGASGDDEIAVAGEQPLTAEGLDLLDECLGIDDHRLAENASNPGTQDTRGDQMGDVFLPIDHDGVAGVGAAPPSGHDLGVFGEQVYDLALAFIAPLSADNNYDWHCVLRRRRHALVPGARAGTWFLVHVIMESKRNGTHGSPTLVDASRVAVPVAMPAQVELGQAEHDFAALRAPA